MTNHNDLSGRTTVVVGASRGLGRGIARAFAEAGAPVVVVARTGPAIAVFAPMPSANVMAATKVNPDFFNNIRAP
jgi:NAD(P)-dependent dehydrogenase (short-subunit alcohol dehydrogenase family)